MINLENESLTSVDHQRQLNPNIRDVVWKDILKLLDAGIIYSISNRTWVFAVHVVKNGGVTVLKMIKMS